MERRSVSTALAKITGVLMITALIVGFSSGCGAEVKHPLKADTSRVYLRFFKTLGARATDTAAFAIKITYDTLEAVQGDSKSTTIKKQWHRDSIYYVPHDTLTVDPKDSTKKKLDQIMILLPKYWNIQDYHSTEVPLVTRPT